MSVQITKAVLKEFLTDAEKNVLALTGAWGSGKTYAWREALQTHKDHIKFKKYCYVSLFGIKNMAELRMSLFTKSVAVDTLGKKLDLVTINEHWDSIGVDWLKGQIGRFSPILKSLPRWGSSVSLSLEAIAPSAVRDTLVCFDDFERQNAICAEDLLGLITELREERGCKIALIFNAEKLSEKDKYRSYREKAIDLEVLFAPTVQESFDLIFDSAFKHRELVLRNVFALRITNVRILSKIYHFIKLILAPIESMHPKVIEASITTIVLLCWCSYDPSESKPKVEEIKSWNKHLMSLPREAEKDHVNLAWVLSLKAYGFEQVNDFDLAIADIVECGYVQGTAFIEVAKKLDENLRNEEIYAPFNKMWHRFRASFSNDQDEFIQDLYTASLDAIANIKISDLNYIVQLLHKLERDDLANNLIDKCVEANRTKPSTFDLKNNPFNETIDNNYLREVFDRVHSELRQLPGLEEAATCIATNSGYKLENIEAMMNATVDEYEALFLGGDNDVRNLSQLIKGALQFANTEHNLITVKSKEALIRIKKTSLLNKIRVERFGF